MADVRVVLASTSNFRGRSNFRENCWLLPVFASAVPNSKQLVSRDNLHHPRRSHCIFVARSTSARIEAKCALVIRRSVSRRLLCAGFILDRVELAYLSNSFSFSLG